MLWLSVALALLQALVPSAEAPASGSAETLVVFLRGDDSAKFNKPAIYIDGKQIARLDNGRYFSIPLPPNDAYDIAFDHQTIPPVKVRLKNKTVYFEVSYTWSWNRTWNLKELEPTLAIEKIKTLKPLNKKDVRDERVSLRPI